MGTIDSVLIKYGANVLGYFLIGIPVFGKKSESYLNSVKQDKSKITRDYVRNSSLLIDLAGAIGRLIASYKNIQLLAGYTTLVYELKETVEDVKNGKFVRQQVISENFRSKAPQRKSKAK
jgi:ATP-binding cassette subfamily D (ALD) protein 3